MQLPQFSALNRPTEKATLKEVVEAINGWLEALEYFDCYIDDRPDNLPEDYVGPLPDDVLWIRSFGLPYVVQGFEVGPYYAKSSASGHFIGMPLDQGPNVAFEFFCSYDEENQTYCSIAHNFYEMLKTAKVRFRGDDSMY